MPHHQHGEQQEEPRHHVEGEGPHSKERKRHDERIRRPSFTPQQRTGQESDLEPPESEKIIRGPGFTPQQRTEKEDVEK